MSKELDVVMLTIDLPEYQLQAGVKGTVVDVLGEGKEYTVEFFTPEGKTIDVVSVAPEQIRLLAPHVRERDRVALMMDLPAYHLKAGDVGMVMDIAQNGQQYMIEFLNFNGETIAIAPVAPSQIRWIEGNEAPHARLLEFQV
jgi:hypothetical protein